MRRRWRNFSCRGRGNDFGGPRGATDAFGIVTFLQPILLFGLPLALIPVIIHLLNRMRHRPRAWAAMRFLVSATRSSTSNTKLRQWLILACRTLAVILLVLFLARPLAGGWLGWALSPAPDAIVILLDRSASMEAKAGATTKREQALAFLAQAAKPFEETSHLILIDSATRQAQPFARASTLLHWDATGPTDTAADIPAMLRSAVDWLIDNHVGTAEIWIASDGQRSNWQPDDARWKNVTAQLSGMSQRVRIRLLSLDQPAPGNAGVAVKEVVRRTLGEKSELRLAVDLQRDSAGGTTLPLTLTLDGARSESDVRMDGQSFRWRHRLDLGTRREGGWGSVSLPADANAADNNAYFVYGPETEPHGLVVSDDMELARCFAYATASRDGQPARRIPVAEGGSADFKGVALVVWQGPLPSGAEAASLESFAAEGGAVIFFPPGKAGTQQFGGIGWGEVENAADHGGAFRVQRWNEDEGPLAKSDEHFSLPLAQTTFDKRQPVTSQKDTLAAFEDGAAFLTRGVLGKGEFYFCSSLPDDHWSSLSDGGVLVPMLQRLLDAGSQRLLPVSSAVCGELSAVDQAQRWSTVDATAAKDIRTQAGVYRAGDRLLAVNRPPAEDQPEIMAQDTARKLFGDLPFQMMQEKREQSGQLQGEVWRVFLGTMLLILIAEAFLILPPKRHANAGEAEKTRRARPVEAAAVR